MSREPSPRAWIGVLVADLRFHGARTLKDRRGELNSIRDRLGNLGFSVSQTGPADLPARAWVAAACACGTRAGASGMLESAVALIRDSAAGTGGIETCISLFDPEME
ncbi:MAG TPA: DUF503 family protein [Candidatus Fermentibacter daniensis]|jgi:uncharacterized protein YlxP (DUF503 family)|nr:MAG: hypothetical protein AO395_06395 [Candidatus Fermentibacter daniensis]MBP7720372.1 DUF503 family protein [Candidatus Fermentibacter sp.]KZD18073.1 MAG: hypothetical protein AO396_02270 [Candidatus Fermentibacter daniensis]KZD18149.1 MAG: hypothetical protein AO394_03850 [Candidatus Fermentibacter daniensis]MCC6871397.1 DUF503 family protein [Candidatus Fermentibacter sp.]